jgi:hypothetical protein
MSAEMVRFRYYLTEETDEQVKLAKLWIKKFIMLMDKLVTNQTDVAFSYYNAMEKEVQKSATAEAHCGVKPHKPNKPKPIFDTTYQ